MKLYEITQKHQHFFDQLDEIPDEFIEDTFQAIEGEFEEKALSVGAYLQNLKADIEAIAAAEKQLAARRRAKERSNEWLLDYLRRNMEDCGITKIDCPLYSIKLQKNPPKVLVLEESSIPDEFKSVKTEVVIDKSAIKAAGGCEGVKIVQGNRVVIK